MGLIEGESAGSDASASSMASAGPYERVTTLLALVLAFAGVVVTLVRLLYGADFIDEAFYAAQAYHFALGARPFIDQIDPHQTAALLTMPWVRLHLAISGDTTGIMLSMRVCWAVLNGAAAAMSYRLIRKFTDWRWAMLASVSAFAMIPYMIPAPSFNSLGIILVSIAVSLLGLALMSETGRTAYVAAGVVLGVSVIAYPTLAIAAVIAVVGIAVLVRGWREPALVAAGGLAVAVIGLGLLAPYLSGIPAVLAYTRLQAGVYGYGGAGGGLLSKLAVVLIFQARWIGTQVAGVLALVVVVLQLLRKTVPWWLGAATLVALPFLPIGAVYPSDTRTLAYCTTILVVAIAFAFSQRRDEPSERIDTLVVLRAVLAFGLIVGLIFALTSSNGWVFIGIGGAAVLGPAIVVIVNRIALSMRAWRSAELAPLVGVLCAGFVVGTFAVFAMVGAYRDLPPLRLHTQARTGPYAGIITTEANAADTEQLWATLRRISGPSDRLFAYHGLPAAYLFTPARPTFPSEWITPYEAYGATGIVDMYLEYLSDPSHAPTIVVKNLSWPSPPVYQSLNPTAYDPSRDSVERFIEQRYHVVESTPSWQLLRPNTP